MYKITHQYPCCLLGTSVYEHLTVPVYGSLSKLNDFLVLLTYSDEVSKKYLYAINERDEKRPKKMKAWDPHLWAMIRLLACGTIEMLGLLLTMVTYLLLSWKLCIVMIMTAIN